MPTPNPLWLQRIPGDIRRRLELAEAKAREAVNETHAAQALELVAILAPRMPFDEAIDRYIEIMGLTGDEEEIVRTRALSLLSDPQTGSELARERHRGWGFDWRYITPLGALRYIRRQLRRNAEEDLWMELFAARADEALIRTHFKHALVYTEILDELVPPPQSVSLYIGNVEAASRLTASLYQRVLARLAEQHLPRLLRDGVPEEDPEAGARAPQPSRGSRKRR
ncbi:MAG TPA: hypothetical protein VHG28_20295 [Longimicrobiaceae bacterium]|nr:hypothetical protein [Longimicrobiaceae bacterium]